MFLIFLMILENEIFGERFWVKMIVFYKVFAACILQRFRCSATWWKMVYYFYHGFAALHSTKVSLLCSLMENGLLFLQRFRCSAAFCGLFRCFLGDWDRNNCNEKGEITLCTEYRRICRNENINSYKMQNAETFVGIKMSIRTGCRAPKHL